MRWVSGCRELAVLAAAGVMVTAVPPAKAAAHVQTDLVSDIPGLAELTDPGLKNPWSVSESATSPF
jgi:hypothetical protein